ncbi:V-set and immunoglobulin domain-containing protein 1-like [Stegastes partitus]|uniref:V-set and immunoglobulin domain-containing protein 1-like n=1 Tax=Stegastes partitus TaxID=144197 RepID=UPI0004959F1B|nr:PREDICTED: V-set and immunoglobulin domain-containing protein 1-like [Stegastes partitus]
MLLNPRRTRTNMKLLQLVSFFLLTLSGQTATTSMQVKEDDDAILSCSFGTANIKNKVFDWKKDVDKQKKEVFLYSKGSYYGHGETGQDPQFKGRIFHFPARLQFGNASIVIRKTKTSDSGTYTCFSYSTSLQPEIKSSISLTVDPILKPRPEIKGASSRPYITSEKSNDVVLLKCLVRGAVPKPVLEWRDSDGNILAASDGKGNKYDTVLNITVDRTGFYRCVATQKEIYHQTETKIYVPHPGAASQPSVTIVGPTKDGVLLQCEVLGASPELKVFWEDSAGNSIPDKLLPVNETGGSYNIILQTTVTKSDHYRCVTTEGNINDTLRIEIIVRSPGEKPSAGSGLVVGLLGLVAVVVV